MFNNVGIFLLQFIMGISDKKIIVDEVHLTTETKQIEENETTLAILPTGRKILTIKYHDNI